MVIWFSQVSNFSIVLINLKKIDYSFLFKLIDYLLMETLIQVVLCSGRTIQCQRPTTIEDLKKHLETLLGYPWRQQQLYVIGKEKALDNRTHLSGLGDEYYLIIKPKHAILDIVVLRCLVILYSKQHCLSYYQSFRYAWSWDMNWEVVRWKSKEWFIDLFEECSMFNREQLKDDNSADDMLWECVLEMYGNIEDWDVSQMIDMSELFENFIEK